MLGGPEFSQIGFILLDPQINLIFALCESRTAMDSQ